jgi:hypothetical protein
MASRGIRLGSRVALTTAAVDDVLVGTLALLAIGAALEFGEAGPGVQQIASIPEGEGQDDFPAALASPDSTAYVDHGVAVRQGALAGALRSAAAESGLSTGEIVLLATPVANTGSLCAWLLPIVAGARLVVVTGTEAFRARMASSATGMAIVDTAGVRLPDGVAIRTLIACGRPTAAQAQRMAKDVAELRVVEIGLAIGLPISVHPGASLDGVDGDLGRPLRGSQWRVVDGEGQVLPVGVPGELRIDPSDGFLPTGDRVQLLGNGTFEHLGRIDGRVVLSGALVDPAALAKAIEGHPAIREAWVMLCNDLAGEPRLVAFFAGRPGASWTETELRSRVRASFGDEVVPRLFVELDALPRDVTGAVDVDRLASPYSTQTARDYVAPRTDAERYLADVWQEALGVARIGIFDNFFDLGGHSLLCFRVIARIEREKGVRLSPRLFLLNSLEQVATEVVTPDAAREAPDVTSPRQERPSSAQPGEGRRGGGLRDWIKKIVQG